MNNRKNWESLPNKKLSKDPDAGKGGTQTGEGERWKHDAMPEEDRIRQ